MGKDLPKLWSAPTTTNADRKQIIRLIIKEVVLDQKRERGKLWFKINDARTFLRFILTDGNSRVIKIRNHLNGAAQTGINVRRQMNPLTIPGGGKPSGRTALVPGFFAGVQAAHDRFGKLPFASLFDPAIYLAEKGFVMDPALNYWINMRKGVLSRLPETKRVFTKQDGEFYKAGDLFKQPQLAETLRKIAAQGTDYIYQGEWAKKFVAALQSEGGKMTLADLKAYRPTWSEPLQTSYRSYQIYSLGLPSLGGVNTIEAFNLLEAADLKQYGHYTTSPEALYEFIQICRVNYFLSLLPPPALKWYLPDLDSAPESRVKKESARLLWRKMHEPAWEKMLSEFAPKDKAPGFWPKMKRPNHSAGVVVVDGKGNMAAVLHTINTVS
ncbi:MAG: gamma-glutamyltransferase [Blastocatellia bacterium]